MRISFVTQPYSDDFALLDFFEVVVSDEKLERIDLIVAWAKSSGLNDLRSSIRSFRERGGQIRAVVGISLGGTSKQALGLILELVDEAYVFHLPGRTFHPKVYLASGSTTALVLVGSHNLTGGGVQTNFEAGVLSVLDLQDDGDLEFFRAVSRYVDRLLSDEQACRRLDDQFLEELIRSRRYPLADEEDSGGESEPIETMLPASAPEEGDTEPELFGASIFGLRYRTVSRRAPQRPATDERGSRDLQDRRGDDDPVARRWFKQLPTADAQHLRTSHPSGTMTLVQFRHPIDAASYFRDELFGDAAWVTAETRGAGQPREIAHIECTVSVRGEALGSYTFEIRHTPGYEAAQANRTTEFVWGEFANYLRGDDVTGLFATIEKTTSGRYRLIIADEPTGAFRY